MSKNKIDWYAELNAPIITQDKWIELCDYSSSWVTCAVGNQCDIIPRDHPSSAPLDPTLHMLGRHFDNCIGNQSRTEALRILDKIEKRSAELINEINKSK